MANVQLTQGYEAIVDDDCEFLLGGTKWCVQTHGTCKTPRAVRRMGGKIQLMHRFLWDAWGLPPAVEIDHINGNGLDNRRSNLRAATSSQNKANVSIKANNTSGFKGVSPLPSGAWRAVCNGLHIGCFGSKAEAALAYNFSAFSNFGEFANLNNVSAV